MNFTMGKPLAEAFADGVPCERVYYMGFTSDPRWREYGDFPFEWLFVECLLIASSKRRMNAGPQGLFAEAGAEFVALTKALVIRWYEDQGIVVRWPDEALRNVGIALADNFRTSRFIPRIIRARLNQFRDDRYINDRNFIDESIVAIDEYASRDINIPLNGVYDAALINNPEEDVINTFNRTLDYIDHMKHTNYYSMMFPLKRDLTCYMRVMQALYG